MPLVIDVGVGELAATRFAVSPLAETVLGLQLLTLPRPPSATRPWLTWARAEYARSGLSVPTAGPLVAGGPTSFPQFLLPSPHMPQPEVRDELQRMMATRAAQVRASFERVWGHDQPEAARRVAAAPARGLRLVADELLHAHDVLIAPHWARMRAVLLADIAHRARQLAIGGADRLFGDLHPDVGWDAGQLTLARYAEQRSMGLGDRGLVLVPSVLLQGWVQVKRHTTTQTTLRYPARGSAPMWSKRGEPGSALVALLGAARARLLEATRTPTTTSALAADFGVTPSAVSQHLAVLRDNGLVGSERSGRLVLHLVTERGLSLLDGT